MPALLPLLVDPHICQSQATLDTLFNNDDERVSVNQMLAEVPHMLPSFCFVILGAKCHSLFCSLNRHLGQVSRVLKPQGTYLLLSYSDERMPVLSKPEYGWAVSKQMLIQGKAAYHLYIMKKNRNRNI